MRHTLFVAALLLGGAGGTMAQSGKDKIPADWIAWTAEWDEAVKEATARNVPIHVAIHKDN